MPSNEKLEEKFEYFYRPYNYKANTQKYITYSGVGKRGERDPYMLLDELIHTEHFIDTFLKSMGKSARKVEPQIDMQK